MGILVLASRFWKNQVDSQGIPFLLIIFSELKWILVTTNEILDLWIAFILISMATRFLILAMEPLFLRLPVLAQQLLGDSIPIEVGL